MTDWIRCYKCRGAVLHCAPGPSVGVELVHKGTDFGSEQVSCKPTLQPLVCDLVDSSRIIRSRTRDGPTSPTLLPPTGIDLGTTNSAVALLTDGKPQVLKPYGSTKDTLPSVVHFPQEGGECIVGARERGPGKVVA